MRYISPISWPGGKSSLATLICGLFPSKIHTFIEPFAGSASVSLKLLFQKKIKTQLILNDLNTELINFFQDVKDNNIIPLYPNIKSETEAKNLFFSLPKTNKKGWQFLILNRLSFSSFYKTRSFSSARWNQNYYFSCLKRVKLSFHLLNSIHTKILNLDYKKIITKFDTKNSFFFFDPPYQIVSKTLYPHWQFDYQELANLLSNLKGKFILTLNNSPSIKTLFQNFHIYEFNKRYTAFSKHQKIGKELFISNFKLPKLKEVKHNV